MNRYYPCPKSIKKILIIIHIWHRKALDAFESGLVDIWRQRMGAWHKKALALFFVTCAL